MKEKVKKTYKTIRKSIVEYIITNRLFISYVILAIIGTMFLRYFTLGTFFYFKSFITDLAVILIIGGLGYFVKPKNQFKYYFIWLIIFTIINVVNSIYYKFYVNFTSVGYLSTLSQAETVTGSIFEKVSFYDVMYILVPVIFYVIHKKLLASSYYYFVDKIEKGKKMVVTTLLVGILCLGQNVDSYGKNLEDGTNFAKLLKALDNLKGNFRIRFTSSYPTDITDEVIETVKNSKKICECFHIPMQSGNDRILKEMNRRYNVEQYRNIVDKIRKNIKNVTITSDFIAGFPSETEEEFNDTLKIIDELELDYSNTAAYSPRPFTKAGKMVNQFIDEEEKRKRLQILNEKVKAASLKSNEKYIDSLLEVLIDNVKDGVYQGRTRNNKVVHLIDNKDYEIGQFVNARIKRVSTWCMFAYTE